MVEFALVAPILLLLIFGIIDLFSYLYLANVVESSAFKALEVASWEPGLTEGPTIKNEDGSESPNPNFSKAKSNIFAAAKEGALTSLFTEGGNNKGRARLRSSNSDIEIIEKEIDSEEEGTNNFAAAESKSFALLLPTLDTVSNTRDEGFKRQPIGVAVHAEFHPLFPLLPKIDISAKAWGFRENYTSSDYLAKFDCLGKPYNNWSVPNRTQCNCPEGEGMNPYTGQCGCPPGTKYLRRPHTNYYDCLCDVTKLNCLPGQLFDYINCNCNKNLCSNALAATPNFGQVRTDENECGCKKISIETETPTCKSGTCTIGPDNKEVCTDAVTSGCSSANCFNNSTFFASLCGCGCDHSYGRTKIQLDPNQNTIPPTYQIVTADGQEGFTFTNPDAQCMDKEQSCEAQVSGDPAHEKKWITNPVSGNQYCTCVYAGTENPVPSVEAGTNRNLFFDCTYRCEPIYGGTAANGVPFGWMSQPGGAGTVCDCNAGYKRTEDYFSAGEKTACCPDPSCTSDPNSVPWIYNHTNARACVCFCKAYHCTDGVTGKCIAMVSDPDEIANGTTTIADRYKVPNNSSCP